MPESHSRLICALITQWHGTQGTARAADNSEFALSLYQYEPYSALFAAPAAGMSVEIRLDTDGGSGTVVVSLNKMSTTGALPLFNNIWIQAEGVRFFLSKKRQFVFIADMLPTVLVPVAAVCGLFWLFGAAHYLQFFLPVLLSVAAAGSVFRILLERCWIWTDTPAYCLSSQMKAGFYALPDFAAWHTLASARLTAHVCCTALFCSWLLTEKTGSPTKSFSCLYGRWILRSRRKRWLLFAAAV